MNFIPKASRVQSNSRYHSHAAAEQHHRIPSRDEKLAGSCILAVEDEFIIALELQSILEEAGATVIGPAYTAQDALDLLAKDRISAAILDLRLGHDTAAPVAAALAERHIPFVFYTGQPASDPIRRAWPDAPVLSKPAHPEEIVAAVTDIIRRIH